MPFIKPDLRSRVTSDGAVILDISADEVITLNSTGGYVWTRLEQGMTVEQIIAALASETNCDPGTVATDVLEFVAQITDKQLVNF